VTIGSLRWFPYSSLPTLKIYHTNIESSSPCLCPENIMFFSSPILYLLMKSILHTDMKETPLIIGQRFGKLTVLEYKEKRGNIHFWNCKCDCGKVKSFRKHSIVNIVRDCGCGQIKDMSNKRFGKLQVISLHPSKSKSGHALWNCKCDCGKYCVVHGGSLRRGATVSCGCYKLTCGNKNPSFRGFGEISLTRYNSIKYGAKTRHGRTIKFSVSIEYLWELFLKQNRKCNLTGQILTFPTRYDDTTATASLDRIDSSKGYIEGNVQWVHKNINLMKWAFSEKEFIGMCRLVTTHTNDITSSLREI